MRPGLSGWAQVCALCQQYRRFRSEALLRPLLPEAFQHLARFGDPASHRETVLKLAAAELPPLMVGLLNVV